MCVFDITEGQTNVNKRPSKCKSTLQNIVKYLDVQYDKVHLESNLSFQFNIYLI